MTLVPTLYRGHAGFASLRDDWEALACSFGSHFVHFPAWYGAEIERVGDRGVCFLAVRDEDERLFAVLPLQHVGYSLAGIRVPIVQMFYPNEMGVNDVLARGSLQSHASLIANFLRRELPPFLALRWQCALETGCAVSMAADPRDVRPTHKSKFLDFHGGAGAFWAGYSSKFKNRMNKHVRRLGEQGRLELRVVSTPAELPEAFERFLDVEDSGWKGRQGTSLRKQPDRERYYRHLLEDFGRLGLCRINLLSLDDQPIAAHFAIAIRDCLYLLKIGFREDYGRYSPGSVLVRELILHCAERTAIRAISFVTGVDWVDAWHPSAVGVGVFYTGHEATLSRLALRVLRWRCRWLHGRSARRNISVVAEEDGDESPKPGLFPGYARDRGPAEMFRLAPRGRPTHLVAPGGESSTREARRVRGGER